MGKRRRETIMASAQIQLLLLAAVLVIVTMSFLSWQRVQGFQNMSNGLMPRPALKSYLNESTLTRKSFKNDSSWHASGKLSSLSLIDNTHLYKLEETVKVKIVLFDHKKRPKSRGGDMVVVWMKDKKNGAASAGIVKDHDNGTYTGILRTLWTGTAEIRAAVVSSRERIDFTYDMLRKGYQGKSISCTFRSTRTVETTSGYMDINNMKTDNLCNFTSQYHGVPFYCGKPKTPGLRCGDWTQVSSKLSYMTLSSNEQWFSTSPTEYLSEVIKINVISQVEGDTVSASRPCYLQDPRNTWRATPPVGFSYQHTWRPLSCFSNTTTTNSYHHCLANRTLRLYGDSTVRQWFSYLFIKLNLTFRSKPSEIRNNVELMSQKWYEYTAAFNIRHNYTVSWSPHGLPMTFQDANMTDIRPVFVRLEDIPSQSTDILLVNLYSHFELFPLHIYRSRVKRTRRAIEELLIRSPNVMIAIKGPHNFVVEGKFTTTLGGMWGPVYENILKQEFVDLNNRVVYLDFWDMTVALESEDIHPSEQIVKMMLNVFFGHVCKLSK
ncbi:NXPE family member 3-like isoform X1 [Haliotis rufescens]|uniref:NXPE family member 3-like isoform X1 n=2 Tax=Haliotis rufescens TaxID=6454 RepID=UPI00201F9377|nr:NXPE family member 3-like isoform X1 [Haliotis rufescens]